MEDDFRKFEEFMNRMFGEFSDVWEQQRRRHLPLSPSGDGLTIGRKRPYIDIVESDKEIVATAEMPGMNKEDININITSDTLELSAESKHEEEKKGKDYIYRERRSGNYYRSISLPSPVDSNSAKASYNNGILEVKMQKTEVKKKTSLKIE